MKWLLKASSQKALSALPRADALNYLLQHRVTRSLPASDAAFRQKFTYALQHFAAFREHSTTQPSDAAFYEFGTGWDLVIPLAYHALGVERQILVDIRPNLRFQLIADSVRKLERHRADLEREAGSPLRLPGDAQLSSRDDLERQLGITYLAPCDARDTRLPAGSVDFISSTLTLEHIPAPDIAAIFRECARLLRPPGLMSSRIDMQDHYWYFDKSISRYNFLRFSDRTWSLFNSSLQYQNRLRYPDYRALLESAGFEIVSERVTGPTANDLEELDALELAPAFRGRYSTEDLGARSLVVVARTARTAA